MKARSTATLIIAITCVLLPVPIYGDVAPEPGFKRITLNLKVETNEDFSDFRFFIRSGAAVKEVFIKKGETTTISPLGGGAFYGAGKLLAVPGKELEKLRADNGDERLTELEQDVYDGKIPGEIELVDHIFSRTVNDSEAGGFLDPLYRIERDQQVGLRATHVSGGASVSSTPPAQSSGRLFWQSAAAAIVAGIFLVFGITILGILYFRKKEKTL